MEINGKRVVDAKKPAFIKITPRDVKEGDNKNPSSCAAAKAIRHSIPECTNTAEGRTRAADKARALRTRSPQHPRKLRVKVAKIKRHAVTGIRPSGANR